MVQEFVRMRRGGLILYYVIRLEIVIWPTIKWAKMLYIEIRIEDSGYFA